MKTKKRIINIPKYIILTAVAIISIFPFYWMVITALKPPTMVIEYPPSVVPKSFEWKNFIRVFELMPTMATAYLNSLKVALCATFGTLFTSSLAAYAFSKLRFRGKGKLFAALIGTMMIPSQITLIPMYVIFAKLGWVDTHLPLIIPQVLTNAYGVFMIRQYMMRIPRDYIDAAELDGCGPFMTFLKIMLPSCKPILMTLGLLTFVGSWNNYFYPLIILNTDAKFTVPLIVSSFRGVYTVQWELLMAASTAAIAPVVILFLVAQKYFVDSITLSGIK